MNQVMRFYRRRGDQLIPWELELDEQSTVVRDEASATEPSVWVEDPPHLRAYLADLRRRNIPFELQPDGGVLLGKLPPEEQLLLYFFIPSHPCYFEGCDDIRRQWLEDKARLDAGGDCAAGIKCAEGKLMRQYQDRIRPIVLKHIAEHGLPSFLGPRNRTLSAPTAPTGTGIG